MRTSIEITQDTLICLRNLIFLIFCTTFNINLNSKKLKTMRSIRGPLLIHSIYKFNKVFCCYKSFI